MKSDNINESDNVNEKENITAKSGGCAECTATLTDDVKSNSTMLEAAAELIKESDEKERNGKSFLICFVCTGNTCRSPMAAAWFNHAEAERFDKAAGGKELKKRKAISAGLSPLPGAPISENAAIALYDAGIESNEENPWREHRAEKVNAELMKKCDLIIGISGSHTLALISEFPEFSEKICSMPKDIPDPYGGDIDEYKKCLEKIKDGITEFFS